LPLSVFLVSRMAEGIQADNRRVRPFV